MGRVQFIPQMEIAECGAASLAMLLSHHGCHAPLGEVRVACGVSRDGTTALEIVKAARAYGFETKTVKTEVSGLAKLTLPAILHWELNHFLVLERMGRDHADLVDPAHGRRRVTLEGLDRAFTGVAIQVTPGPKFRSRRKKRRTLELGKLIVRSAALTSSFMIGSAVLLEGLALVFPAASRVVVDLVIQPRQERWIPTLAIAFTIAIVLRGALSIARDRILGGLESRIEVELTATLVKHMLSLPTSYFAQRGPGDLLSRVSSFLAARETFAKLFLSALDVILVGAYAALMLLNDLRLGAAVISLRLATVVVGAIGRERGRTSAVARQVASSQASSAVVQAFSDVETTKAFGAEPLLLSRYAAARSRELNARADSAKSNEPAQHALTLLESLGGAVLLWFGGRAVLDERITIGLLSSFLMMQGLLAAPLNRLVASFQDLGDVGPLLDRVDDVFDATAEPTGTYVPATISGAITFEEVSFRYAGKGPLLLDRVSFRIQAGERLAIVGRSGAGKSTILRLILGILQPTSGRILIDGRDLREYDIEALRSSIGTVLANGSFFDESVFDNLTIGAPEATLADVRAGLAGACVADVVYDLPEGPLARLGAGATRLSGGQKQRLLISRALVKDAPILLLDEASSALDADLEERIKENLSQLGCTMVIVAHRLSAVALAERVLLLDQGKIVQDGPFAQLEREPGPFRELVKASRAR